MCNFCAIYSKINKNMKSILSIIVASSLFFFSVVEANPNSTHYGPVKEGETLWYIAYKHKPAGVTRWNMMRAIHLHNRSSFNGGDINLLQKGAVLRIPVSKQEVTQFIRGTAKTVKHVTSTSEQAALKKANTELRLLREELAQSRATLSALKKESRSLTKGERSQYEKNIENLQQKYARSQQRIVKLEQENAAIKQNQSGNNASTDSVVALKIKELKKANKEVAALKQQNSLLEGRALTGDVRTKNTQKKDRLVSETIAALNADIGQLRSRIQELEELEKLKDAHIVELKKTLQHATKVIKDQSVLNKKMHAQLADMNMVRPLAVQQNENKQAGVAPPLSQMVKNVSPKFWLLLTLGGLLLVLTLLWRSLSQRTFVHAEIEREEVNVLESDSMTKK